MDEIAGLRDQLEQLNEGLRHVIAFDKLSHCLTGATMLRPDEICGAASPNRPCSGVYFLIASSEIIYVGQSVDVYVRVGTHRKEKEFDSWAYVPCPRNALDFLESLYIHNFRPKLNGQQLFKEFPQMVAPIALPTLLAMVADREKVDRY